ETEQIIAAEGHHVDRQVVAGVNPEIGTQSVACRQPPQLDGTIQRRMLGAHEIWNLDDTSERLIVPNLTMRCEYSSELKRQRALALRAGAAVDGRLVRGTEPAHGTALYDDRHSAALVDGRERGVIAAILIGERAGVEACAPSQHSSRRIEHCLPLARQQQVA